MFWILRRTGAANFFNSLNNNCSTSKGSGSSQTTLDKYVKRPPRKAYGRLSADSDDAASAKHKIDDPFDEVDNFGIATNANSNGGQNISLTNGCQHHHHQNCNVPANEAVCGGVGGSFGKGNVSCGGVGDCGEAICGAGIGPCGNGLNNTCKMGSSICHDSHCNAAAALVCQGNFTNGNLCECMVGSSGGGAISTNGLLNMNSSSSAHHLSSKEVNENTINRLQSMAMSDDDDYDESLTCNVCDRAFHCHRQLASHQQKKRHFGCSGCDSLFPSLMLLEHHKEEFEHWSDDELSRRVCCRRNRGEDYFTDTDSFTSDAESEDLERLL